MSRASLIQTSNIGGEISRAARARHDIAAYPNALELCRNAIVRTTGAADKRGGFVLLGAAKVSTGRSYWVVFKKSNTDVVRIEVSGGKLRFWDGATRSPILSSGTPYEIDSPWSDDEMTGLRWWQSGDVMWFAQTGGQIPTKVLKRFAPDNWTISNYAWDDGPFMSFEANNSIAFSDVTGTGVTVTLTMADRFLPGHVGALIRAEAVTFTGMTTWAFDSIYNAGDIVRHGNNIYKADFTGSARHSGDSAPIHISGSAFDGGPDKVNWTFLGFTYGLATITDVAGPRNATVDILSHLPYYPDGFGWATTSWRLGAFCDAHGWPRAGTIYEERLTPGGNFIEPDTVFPSAAAQYDPNSADMSPGALTEVLDSDAIRRSLASSEVNPIVWMIGLDALLVGTEGGVYRIAPPSPDEALTPAGTTARLLVAIPCSELVRPVLTPTAFIYVPFHEGELIEVQRNDQIEPRNLAELAEHMIAAGVQNIAWARKPSNALWVLDNEGYLASMTYSPENSVVAWSAHAIGGDLDGDPVELRDICTAPGPYRTDELWAFVDRTVNGATLRTIEYMERTFNQRRMRLEDACCLDGAGHFDQWNVDPAKTMTWTPDAPGSLTGTLTASGHAPFNSGHIGRQIFLRKVKPTPKPSDSRWPVRLKITGYTSSTSVAVTAQGDYGGLLASTPVDQWAFAITEIAGLSWLEGRTDVRVNGDGGDYGPFTVVGGALTVPLPEPIARGWAGLPYTQQLRSLPPNAGEASGAARGAVKRIDKAFVMIDGAAAGTIGRVGSTEQPVAIAGRLVDAFMGMTPPAVEADVWEDLPGGFDRDGQIEFLNSTSLPAGIAGWVFRTTTNA